LPSLGRVGVSASLDSVVAGWLAAAARAAAAAAGVGRCTGGRLRGARQGGTPPGHARTVFDHRRDMAGALEDAEEASHGAWLPTLEHRARLHPDLLHDQVVTDQVEVVLGIGLGGPDHLRHVPRGRARHELACRQGLADRKVSQALRHQPHLAR